MGERMKKMVGAGQRDTNHQRMGQLSQREEQGVVGPNHLP